MIDKIRRWYHTSFQTTVASILGSFALADFVALIANEQDAVTTLLGRKWYAAVRVAGAIGIIWRAQQARRAKALICSNCGQEP